MRKSDFVVGELYVLTCRKENGYITPNSCGIVIPKGTVFRCNAVDPDSYWGIEMTVETSDPNVAERRFQKGLKFSFHTGSGLEPFLGTNPQDTRNRRSEKADKLEKEKERLVLEHKRALEVLEPLSKKISEIADRIGKLRMYETDEEELAATFSQIIKTGGDEKAILEILKARPTTDKL